MIRLSTFVLLVAAVAALLAGCPQQEAPEGMVEEPPNEIAEQEEIAGQETSSDADGAVHLAAYINVASGCQDWTVQVLNDLNDEYDSVDVEIIDFGTPEGMERMRDNGISCMTLLFEGSPVVQFPDEDGGTRTVTFYFPVGFGWTHEDLEAAFAAIDAGEADILSEEEAREALAPEQVEMEVTVEETEDGVDVLMNGQVALTITEEAGGKTPMERAEEAQAALTEWTGEAVHPRQLSIVDQDDGWSVMGRDAELIRVYKADAEAAGMDPGKKLASQWFKGIRCGIVAAARGKQDTEGVDPSAGAVCPVE
ncbi:MAG: hypothetical protein GF393_04135 [Armatimonadia bacterium]|nr:hypothetical protein [Armatimonadia bacterium]